MCRRFIVGSIALQVALSYILLPLSPALAEMPSLNRSMLEGPSKSASGSLPLLRPIPLRLAAATPAQEAIAEAARARAMLSPTGRDIAEQIGVMGLIDELIDVRNQLTDNPALTLKHMQLKQKLLQTVLIASLQVRDATARIDHEVAELNRLSGGLQDQRDRALKTNTMANIFGNGAMNEIGQAGEMKTNEVPGEIVELVSGALVVALGGLALRQQNGSSRPMPSKPNMLAKVLGCPTDKDTEYPPVIWNYLNRAPAGSTSIKTRLQILTEQWQQYKTIEKPKSPKSRKRAADLTNTAVPNRVSLDLLGDRIAMLGDVKAEIFQMDRDLLELLLNVQGL
ncbi:MAG: hypothetical protein JST01_12885 [Cyanobacteria bacterium SZAS TMP-1]|nr:hypothetical protein [Cyanobacteria bacterium SZAS TMP-1]